MPKSVIVALVLAVTLTTAAAAAAASITETFTKHNTGSTKTVDHSAWDKLLKRYVSAGADGLNRVDYAGFKSKGHGALKAYVRHLESTDVDELDKAEQFAFWVNLYNAKTIDVVLDHYPVDTIRKISIETSLIGFIKNSVGVGGPWRAKIINVADRTLSLDDVEHKILRPIFKDPRVHYAVNCASIGCPNLRINAFTKANLEDELNQGAIAYVNSPRGFAVVDGAIKASSIYRWFQVDFGGSEGGVLAHARKYAKPALKAKLANASSISEYAYDWRLNDVKN